MWPNFFIVGAPKAGTTWLYWNLRQHPDVFLPHVKEPHFFSRVKPNPAKGYIFRETTSVNDYLALYQRAERFKALGDASPSYLVTEAAAVRIREQLPDARIIILLRDPIERTFSQYLMDVRDGVQDLSLFEAILSDHQIERKGWGISRMYVEDSL